MRVTLVDYHGSLSDAARACGWAACLKDYTDVREMPREPGTAFVSPANSLGFMDGGIDYVYSRLMFPGLEAVVRNAIATHSAARVSKQGRPYLPIGRALVVPVQQSLFVVVAPTMLTPQDVRGTNNAYHATYAALEAAHATPGVEHLVFPGMCTGCGMLSAPDAVGQMRRAHADFTLARPPAWTAAQIDAEQPPWQENAEFVNTPCAL